MNTPQQLCSIETTKPEVPAPWSDEVLTELLCKSVAQPLSDSNPVIVALNLEKFREYIPLYTRWRLKSNTNIRIYMCTHKGCPADAFIAERMGENNQVSSWVLQQGRRHSHSISLCSNNAKAAFCDWASLMIQNQVNIDNLYIRYSQLNFDFRNLKPSRKEIGEIRSALTTRSEQQLKKEAAYQALLNASPASSVTSVSLATGNSNSPSNSDRSEVVSEKLTKDIDNLINAVGDLQSENQRLEQNFDKIKRENGELKQRIVLLESQVSQLGPKQKKTKK